MRSRSRGETGTVLTMVLLGILTLVAVGLFLVFALNHNTDQRFAFQKSIAGFNAAEAGINVGAAGVMNAMTGFGLPTDCSVTGTSFPLNGRTVTYALSVPGGTPGSCAETPKTLTEPSSSPFVGLNAIVYTYDLTSAATNPLGFTEASVGNRFQAHLIPVFQFMGFYAQDLEYLPGPTLVVNGRLHTNGDLYLNSNSCGAAIANGMNILGQITVVGSGRAGTAPLNRGRKDDLTINHDNVYISLDGTPGTMQVLGTGFSGDTSCAQVNTRQIGAAEISTFNTGGQIRVATGMQNISLPVSSSLICTPWTSGCSGGGAYWQHADVRIVLDTTVKQALVAGQGPSLYPVEVLAASGGVDAARTAALRTFMQTVPGAITYSDVPVTTNNKWDCHANASCESQAYANGSTGYATPFPTPGPYGCTATRGPRTPIYTDGSNYCNDYRYGGYYSTREGKPILMLNIDWMALEEWNRTNGNPLFDETTTTDNGLVVFLSVKDTTATEGDAATNYGVRVYDAARVQRNSTDPGVAFASDQAFFVAGNFNCPVPTYTGSDSAPAPCGDAAWPPATGAATAQKSVSVSADTVNLLSCAWVAAFQNGALSGSSPCGSFAMDTDQWATVCGSPVTHSGCRLLDEASTTVSGSLLTGATCSTSNGCQARETIVNSAFLAGNDQTWCPSNANGTNCGNAYYSGGLENYPRLAEDWSGTDPSTGRVRKLWYQGSFVSLGPPYHDCFEYTAQLIPGVSVGNDPLFTCARYPLQGFWSTQRYSPPPRRWFYDVSFDNAAFLPPLSPRFVYLSQIYFTEPYK